MAHEALETIEYGDEPAVLVFGDSEAALDRARKTAQLARCRLAGAALVGDAVVQLDRHAATRPILLELEADAATACLVGLLDRLDFEARSHGRRSIVVAPASLTDLVAARAWHRDIVQQCAPNEPERVAALAMAARPVPVRLNDIGREGNNLLQQLSEEMGRIANILASLSDDEAAELSAARADRTTDGDGPPLEAGYVRALIRARRLRDQYFHGELFADPAWDMLLDLMAARLEGNRVAVSSLCIAAAVPATTALRWIKALTDRGLFIRSADPEDGRRVYIELSDDTARLLAAYLRAAQRIAPAVI